MKCIHCDKDAEYIYLGISYCKEHKDEHVKRMKVVIEKAERKDGY